MRYSNNLELALWMESERLLHPIINQIGRHAERGYQGKELSLRQPYGKILPIVKENMFESHPYRWSTIGSMEHLDTATLEDFKDFHKNLHPQQCCFSSGRRF
jgi:predicted Zn-dependent peptidase